MNLATLRESLRRMIGNPTTADVTDGQLLVHINTAYRELTNKYRFHLGRKICTFDTIQGVSRYGLFPDLASIIRVRNNTTEVRMEMSDSRRRYEEVNMTANVQLGKPVRYIRFRDWMELMPIPDGVYEIEVYYKMSIVDLAADGDSPVIPESWHRGILLLSRYVYYDEEGDIPKATTAYARFNTWVQDQPTEVDEEKSDLDTGVAIPTLGDWSTAIREDFNHSD